MDSAEKDQEKLDRARELLDAAKQKVKEDDKPAASAAATEAVRILAEFDLRYVG